ncbi:hypothetical protein Tco_0901070 [Tanacetum coccineum]
MSAPKFADSHNMVTFLAKPTESDSVKFLMYPRFVQVFLDKQVGDMSTYDEIFVTPSHIKKVFGNMKRVGKGFSGAVTPLFPTMIVQAQEEMGEEPIADEATNEENVPTQSNDPPILRVNILGSGEDRQKLKELMGLYDIEKDAEVNLVNILKEVVATFTMEVDNFGSAWMKLGVQKPKVWYKRQMKEQIRLDEELTFKLQAKEEEQARLAREKAEKVEEANNGIMCKQ